ncbi:hypothetical protein FRC03_010471 [Tulasnella sp. 419]|nr:hypothetical protein FRC03_010471 [Tulasnella sp. 419]
MIATRAIRLYSLLLLIAGIARSAITFYLPLVLNGANVSIKFSDGSTYYHDTYGGGCDAFFRVDLPKYQYKPLTVTLRPSAGLYLNIKKFVVTSLTVEEQSSLASFSSISALGTAAVPVTSQPIQTSGVGGSNQQQNENQSSSSNTGAIIGGVLGGVLGAIIIGILAFVWYKKQKQNQNGDRNLDMLETRPSPWTGPDRSSGPAVFVQPGHPPITPHTQPSEFSYSSGIGSDVPPPEYPGPSNPAASGTRPLPTMPTTSPLVHPLDKKGGL